jgi:hypothetical protein
LAIAPSLNESEVLELTKQLRISLPECLRDFLTQASADCSCHYWWEPLPDKVLEWSLDQTVRDRVPFKDIFPSERFIFGGARLCNAQEFKDYQQGCSEWVAPVTNTAEVCKAQEEFRRLLSLAMSGDAALSAFDTVKDGWQKSPEVRDLWQQSVPFLAIRNGDYLALDVRRDVTAPPVVYLDHDGPEGTFTLAPTFHHLLKEWEQLCYIGPEHWLLCEFLNPDTGYIDSQLPKGELLREMFSQLTGRPD